MFGQAQPTAMAVAANISQAYSRVQQFEADVEATRLPDDKPTRVHIAFDAPKYRVETEAGTPPGTSIVVFDGSRSWVYSSRTGTYYIQPVSAMGSGDSWIAEFRDIPVEFRLRGGTGMLLLADDVVEMNDGSSVSCFVLEVQFPRRSVRYWADKQDYRVLRKQEGSETYTFKRIDLNRPVPRQRFVFAPPLGSREVEPPSSSYPPR